MTIDDQILNIFEQAKLRNKGGVQRFQCPNCSHTRNKKSQKVLAIDVDEGWAKCHHCGYKFTIKKHKAPDKKAEPQPLRVQMTNISHNAKNFIIGRGITPATVESLGGFEKEVYFPAINSNSQAIGFPCNYEGKTYYVQYRSLDAKEFVSEKGGTPIFFNIPNTINKSTVIVTEGYFDACSFAEAGFTSVLSVPNGASVSDGSVKFLDETPEIFDDKKRVYLATDADSPGRKLMEELARRIGKERCVIINYPKGCKDINDVLQNYGTNRVRECVKNAEDYPIDSVFRASDLSESFLQAYESGIDRGVKAGMGDLDDLCRWKQGMLYLILGKPKSGKSNVARQIYKNLALYHDWRIAVFSAEEKPYSEAFIPDIAEQYIGKPFWGGPNKMSREDVKKAQDFIEDHFFFIDTPNLDSILERTELLVKRYGINMLTIDPWAALEGEMNKFQRQDLYLRSMLNKMREIRKKLNIAITIVIHPSKLQKDKNGNIPRPSLYDASGGAEFLNHLDIGMVVDRDYERGLTMVNVDAVRKKYLGEIGQAVFNFDVMTNIYESV